MADHNAPGAVGVGPLPVNCVDGRRVSTALAYLEPARGRANLTVRAGRPVREILIRGGRATGARLDGPDEVIGAEVAAVSEEESESSEQPATNPIARPTLATVTASR